MKILNKGISGYYTQGPKGTDGEQGSSVYFCAYDVSDNINKVTNIILDKGVLSDNLSKQYEYRIDYKDGDVLIDSVGSIFYITNDGTSVSYSGKSIFNNKVPNQATNTSEQSTEQEITIECSSSYVHQKNVYNYKSVEDEYSKSPFYTHRDSMDSCVHGFMVNINIPNNDIRNNKILLAHFIFDDVIEHVVDLKEIGFESDPNISTTNGIFIDNKFFIQNPNCGSNIKLSEEKDPSSGVPNRTSAKFLERTKVFIEYSNENEPTKKQYVQQ